MRPPFRKTAGYLALLFLLLVGSSSGDSASPAVPNVPNGFNPGPDVIAGFMFDLDVYGTTGTQRGLAIGITSCNAGDQLVGFFAMPATDHPAVAQNLYRMSGGSGNSERFEQIGQSWVKHTYGAKQANGCSFGCQPGGDFTHLGVGCSDTYLAFQSAVQADLGSRAWINPFTGVFPSTARDHTGHVHTAVSHMILVEDADLNPAMNPGASYYAELLYVTPNEYTWCQAHPGECNMYNNASYLRYNISGTTSYTFAPVGSVVRMTPAFNVWPGATIRTIEPEPGIDGRAFLAYKVTGPVGGLYHYEYAIYNQNLDRGIQSFSVPRLLIPAVSAPELLETNVDFHGPPQHPGFPADGTQGNAGFSSADWSFTAGALSLTWNSETFAQNPNANAIRWGTLYNFRFDTTTPPVASNATVGFFKTGAPIAVAIEGPAPIGGPSPTPMPINISGTISYCTNPVPSPVPNVTLTLTGGASSSTSTDAGGNYLFSGLASGGSYSITPAKTGRIPGSAGIGTVDVVAAQRHYLAISVLTGCPLKAADVSGDSVVTTVDVIAIQRFFLGLSTGIANTGKYQFTPANRAYSAIVSDQTGQNYDTLVFGDVTAPFVE